MIGQRRDEERMPDGGRLRAWPLVVFGLAVIGLSVVLTSGIGVAASTAAPTSTAEPVVSGSPALGSTLTATEGTWTGSPTSFTFQWVRCGTSGGSEDGSDCAVIGGATTAAYIVASGDVGSRLRVRVTASNADGATTVASNATTLIGAAPARVSDPVVTGTARVGSTLTASQGGWTNSPTSFTYRWVRCPASGGDPLGETCAAIGGATSSSYVVASGDVGARLRARVTASNSSGSTTSASNATPVVSSQPQGPRNTGEPGISGTARVGSTLTASSGSWTGSPTSYAFQWYSCPSTGGRPDATDCSALGGATARSYVPAAGTVGRRLRVRVTATNASGSGVAVSNPTAAVQAAPPATGCPAGTGPVPVSQLTSPARLLVDGQSITPFPVGRSSTVVTMRFRVSACGGRPVQGALVYATAVPYNQYAVPPEQMTGADGWAQVTTSQGRAFPAAERQQLLVVFVRARKPGENVLGGISTRRLVSFAVDLRR